MLKKINKRTGALLIVMGVMILAVGGLFIYSKLTGNLSSSAATWEGPCDIFGMCQVKGKIVMKNGEGVNDAKGQVNIIVVDANGEGVASIFPQPDGNFLLSLSKYKKYTFGFIYKYIDPNLVIFAPCAYIVSSQYYLNQNLNLGTLTLTTKPGLGGGIVRKDGVTPAQNEKVILYDYSNPFTPVKVGSHITDKDGVFTFYCLVKNKSYGFDIVGNNTWGLLHYRSTKYTLQLPGLFVGVIKLNF